MPASEANERDAASGAQLGGSGREQRQLSGRCAQKGGTALGLQMTDWTGEHELASIEAANAKVLGDDRLNGVRQRQCQ